MSNACDDSCRLPDHAEDYIFFFTRQGYGSVMSFGPISARRQPDQYKQAIDSILEATAQVLKQVGTQETTIDRIAEQAGESVGSIHYYFPNKIAIYEALMRRHFERIAVVAYSLSQRCAQASADEFPELIADILLATDRQDILLSSLLRKIAAIHPSVGAVEIEHAKMLEMAVGTLIQDKLAAPGFRSNIDPELSGAILTRALMGLVRRTLTVDPPMLASDQFAAEFQQLIRGYLLARK